jgi:uncharacterized membrane protein
VTGLTRSRARPDRRERTRALLWPLALAVAAGLPIIGAAVRDISEQWVPLGDNAFTAVRALDVLTSNTPLAGQWSSGATTALGEPVDSPGPMLFWLFALPVRLPDARALPLTMAIVNLACIAGSLVLARRRGGNGLMVALALFIAVMLGSLPADVYTDIWNSSSPLMPLVLAAMLAWSVGAGEYRLLPLAALVWSFVFQSHLVFVAPVAGLALGALALLGWQLRGGDARQARPWIAAAVAVLVLCWSLPAADLVFNEGGNPSRIVRSARADVPKLGAEAGWNAVVQSIGVRPRWLRTPPSYQDWKSELLGDAPLKGAVSTVVLVVGLLVALLIGLRRRDFALAAAGVVGVALCAGIYLVTASTPTDALANVPYTLRWVSPAGMAVWLVGGWSAVRLGAPVLRRWSVPPTRFREFAGAAGLVLVLAISTVVLVRSDRLEQPYEVTRSLGDQLVADLPDRGTTRLEAPITEALFLGAHEHGGLVSALRRAGRAVTIDRTVALGFGDQYADRPYDHLATVAVGDPQTRPGRRIAHLQVFDPWAHEDRTVDLWLAQRVGSATR